MLLVNHARLDLRNKYGDTPLDAALHRNDVNDDAGLIKLLRQAGAKTGKELSQSAK